MDTRRRGWVDPDPGGTVAAKGRYWDIVNAMKVREIDPERDQAKRLEDERVARLDAMRAGITQGDYWNIARGTLERTEAVGIAEDWVTGLKIGQSPTFLVLSGDQGRGKTVAAVNVIASHGGKWITWHELRRLHRSNNYRDQDEFRNLYTTRIVVLDDFGRGSVKNDDEDVAFEFVHGRQGKGLYTLITTNFSEEEIKARFNVYVADRLTHSGMFVPLKGPNLRGGE